MMVGMPRRPRSGWFPREPDLRPLVRPARYAFVIFGLMFVMIATLATYATIGARRDAMVKQLRQQQDLVR